MARAYLKINVEPGEEREVVKKITAMENVLEANLTSGEQDIIALIQASNYEELMRFVVTKLRAVEGISRTITNLILD
ncbi:MAG: Lrp/AsnC ligand binding domain-containing protein [Candidatus Omnitrophica bacterium]|nr:Lrp/AsnC ligand binding domain-containing protein [Candidatus Omnitrophota bacterium]